MGRAILGLLWRLVIRSRKASTDLFFLRCSLRDDLIAETEVGVAEGEFLPRLGIVELARRRSLPVWAPDEGEPVLVCDVGAGGETARDVPRT